MSGDAHTRLLSRLGRAAGPGARLLGERAEPWLTATFAGMRHRVAFSIDDRAAADRLAAMGRDALAIPGHWIADLGLVARRRHGEGVVVELAALTVERAEAGNGREAGLVGSPWR